MAKLQYTKKYRAYENGERTESKLFAFGDQEGFKVRAVRKYQNSKDGAKFKTVEITEKHYRFLINTMNFFHNELCEHLEILDNARVKLTTKEKEIQNFRDAIDIAEET